MNEASVVSLTAALRDSSVKSYQYEQTVGSDNWTILADSPQGTWYTMTQIANLSTTHAVTGRTDRAEFGPATAAAMVSLETSLKNNHVEYRTYERVTNSGNWYLMVTTSSMKTIVEVQALETSSGIAARTNRVEFK